MNAETHVEMSLRLGDTAAAVTLAFLFYPMTIAPIGVASNGGVLGLGSLIVASFCAWRALALNLRSAWLRRLLHIPLAAFITYMAIQDAFVQLVWWWLGS